MSNVVYPKWCPAALTHVQSVGREVMDLDRYIADGSSAMVKYSKALILNDMHMAWRVQCHHRRRLNQIAADYCSSKRV